MSGAPPDIPMRISFKRIVMDGSSADSAQAALIRRNLPRAELETRAGALELGTGCGRSGESTLFLTEHPGRFVKDFPARSLPHLLRPNWSRSSSPTRQRSKKKTPDIKGNDINVKAEKAHTRQSHFIPPKTLNRFSLF